MTDRLAFFLDVDGTLMSNFSYEAGIAAIHPKNIEAIKKARGLGHYVFVNTGRAYSWIPDCVKKDLKIDGIISGMGSQILFNGEVIYEKYVDIETVSRLTHYYFNTKNMYYVSGISTGYVINRQDWLSKFGEIPSADFFDEGHEGEKIQKLEVFGKNIDEKDKEYFSRFLNLYAHPSYFECGPKDCSKARAMLLAADRLGIKYENIIAMGDSVNDIEMLNAAGIKVAVGNATKEVKAICDFVSKDCSDGGVGYAIEKYIG